MKRRGTCAIIYHRGAGRGTAGKAARMARDYLQQSGWEVSGCFRTRYAGHARDELAPEWGGRVDRLVAVGGDGTLREVCCGLRRGDAAAAVGFVPAGRGNMMARELGIPLNPPAAARVAAGGISRRIDMGAFQTDAGPAGELTFLSMVETGFFARVVAQVSGMRQGPWQAAYRFFGDLLYAAAAVAVLADSPRVPLEIRIDGREAGVAPVAALFANARTYAKGWTMAPGARIDDGRLDYVLRYRENPAQLIRLTLAAILGRKPAPSRACYGRGLRFTVRADEPFPVQADGDFVGFARRLEIRIEPQAVRMLMPA